MYFFHFFTKSPYMYEKSKNVKNVCLRQLRRAYFFHFRDTWRNVVIWKIGRLGRCPNDEKSKKSKKSNKSKKVNKVKKVSYPFHFFI